MRVHSHFIRHFAGVAVGALVLTGMAAAAPVEARYVDKAYHYSFAPPDGWTRRTDLPRPIVAYVGPAEQGYAANVNINLYANPIKSADELTFVRSIKIDHGTVYAMKRTTLGGRPAHTWRTHLRVPGYPVLENRQIVCIVDGHAYELTFTMLPSLMSKYDPIWDKLIASFHWDM